MAQIDTPYDLTTKQGIFDHVATRLLAQGKPSIIPVSPGNIGFAACRYRYEDCACAAGHLMPDDPALLDLTGVVGSAIVNAFFDDRISHAMRVSTFMRELQRAHDDGADHSDWCAAWRRKMLDIADRYGLDASVFGPQEEIA